MNGLETVVSFRLVLFRNVKQKLYPSVSLPISELSRTVLAYVGFLRKVSVHARSFSIIGEIAIH